MFRESVRRHNLFLDVEVQRTPLVHMCVYIFLQMQSSVSVSKILVKTVEHVRSTLSATHVIVHQGTMVPCVKMVSKITKRD